MKLYLSTLALSLLLLYLADTTITWRPFSISFGRGWLVLGMILIIAGCMCMWHQWYSDGLKRGAEIKKEVFEEIKERKIKETI